MSEPFAFVPGQEVYVASCGMGRYGNSRICSGINPLTKKPWEPVVTINAFAGRNPSVMVNTEMGPVAIDRVSPR